MNTARLFVPTVLLMLSTTLAAEGGDVENALIDKVVNAYGGDALTGLSSYAVDVSFLGPTTGQSRTPDLVHINRINQILTVDVPGGRGRFETFFGGRGGGAPATTITDGTNAWTVNHQTMTYGEAASPDIYTIGGGTMRTTDTILAFELNKAREQAEHLGTGDYMNRPHEMVKIPFPQSPDLTIYVDSETHLISKMVRMNPALGSLDYIFTDYRHDKGITYAASVNFFVAGDPNLVSTRHDVRFNVPVSDDMFAPSSDLSPEGKRIDTAEMLANKISDKVYHVGTGNGYSLFVDTGESVIAAGGYPGIKDRLSRFGSETGSYKPLAYQIVTHHHNDHLGGLGEALDLGAQLVTVAENVDAIRETVTQEISDAQFLTIDKRATFGQGRNRAEIYEVSTIHAASFLLTYVPAQKLLFMADHLGSPFETGVPTANLNTVTMLEALEELDLDIKKIATAHSARIFTWKEMVDSVAQYKPFNCTSDLPICM